MEPGSPVSSPTAGNEGVSVIYRFLATCLKYPEPSWLTPEFCRSLADLAATLGAETEAAELSGAMASDPGLIETLQVEHTRLFINGFPHVAAPPYGSVYIDGSLQGPHTAATLSFYRERGFEMAEQADLPDHLIHELEFLAHLAADGDQAGEREFLHRLFRVWFPDFRDRVLQEARHPYYRMVIHLIDYFTKEE